jgi:hypothetical protein
VTWVCERTTSTERSPLVGEINANIFSMTDSYGRILGFLDRNCYYFFQVAPQLYSRGWMDPVKDPLLLRKSGSAGNRIRDLRICNVLYVYLLNFLASISKLSRNNTMNEQSLEWQLINILMLSILLRDICVKAFLTAELSRAAIHYAFYLCRS